MGVAKDRGFQKYVLEHEQDAVVRRRDPPAGLRRQDSARQFQPEARRGVPSDRDAGHAGGVRSQLRSTAARFHPKPARRLPAVARIWIDGAVEREHPGRAAPRRVPPEPRSRPSTGVIDIPLTTGFYSPPKQYKMGYIQSWNLTIREGRLLWRFIGQAGYVGSRQKEILQTLNLNAGQIPAPVATASRSSRNSRGPATRRSSATSEATPTDSLQATLRRGFANGVQFNLSYTLSKAIGQCCDDLSDKNQAIQIPAYMHLNKSLTGYDRTHVFTASSVAELPFGKGRRFLTSGIGSIVLGGWQLNGLFAVYSGTPFSVSAAGTSLNAPGNAQRADQVKPDVKILGGSGAGQPVTSIRWRSRRSPRPVSAPRASTRCADPASSTWISVSCATCGSTAGGRYRFDSKR